MSRPPSSNSRNGQLLGLALLLIGMILGGVWLRFGGSDGRDQAALHSEELAQGIGPSRKAPESGTQDSQGGQGASTPGRDAEPTGERVDLLADSLPQLKLGEDEGVLRRGRVLARADGRALEGAQVLLLGEDWELRGESDVDGEFELRLPEGSSPSLLVECAGFAPQHRPAFGAEDLEVIELDPAARLLGELRGPEAQEAAGGEVYLWRLGEDHRARDSLASATVDAQGRFQFDQLAVGEYSLGASVPGWSLGVLHGTFVALGEERLVVIELTRGATVRGRAFLRDSQEALEGVTITATPVLQGVAKEILSMRETILSTDAEGQYEISGVAPGVLSLRAESEWDTRRSTRLTVFESGEELEQDFELHAPGSLMGHVQTTNGQGVGFARVFIGWDAQEPWNDPESEEELAASAGSVELRSDVNGRFELKNLPAGRKLRAIAVRGEEGSDDWLSAQLLGQFQTFNLSSGEEREHVVLKVFETRALRGEVRDLFGKPIAGARLELTQVGDAKQNRGQSFGARISDGEGAFAFSGLVPGWYNVEAEADGFLLGRRKFAVTAAMTSIPDVELELQSCARLEGWVIDQFGDSVPYARVSAKAIRLDARAGTPKVSHGERADAYGRFEFEKLEEGGWAISAKAHGYQSPPLAETVLTSDVSFVELELEKEAQASRVEVRGQLFAKDGGVLRGVRLTESRGGALELEGDRFRITGARAGRGRFGFEAPGYLPTRTPATILPAGGEVQLGTVEFVPAAELTVFVRDKKGKALSKFAARLEPLKGSERLRKARTIKLATMTRRHRFKGGKKTVKAKAAHSAVVPLGSWRLIVTRAGYQTLQRTVSFDGERRKQSLEVELKKR